MAPNHRWNTTESILGPVGSHWVQKMGQNRKKLPCPRIRIVDYCHRFFAKNGSYGYGTKSRWGPPRVHLRANGVPLGQKRKKLPCPKIRIFDNPAVIDFSQKMEVTVMAPNLRRGPPRVHLAASEVQLGPKNVSNRKKITMPQNSNFRLPHSHRFFAKKMELTVMAPNHRGDPLGSIFGSNGVPLG